MRAREHISHRRQKSEGTYQRAARTRSQEGELVRDAGAMGFLVSGTGPKPWAPRPISPPIKDKK